MSKGAKCEIYLHSHLYTATDRTLLQRWLKHKNTLTKEDKTYWEQCGFDEELNKHIKVEGLGIRGLQHIYGKAEKNLSSQLEGRLHEKKFLKKAL